jgi:hypothetical protein
LHWFYAPNPVAYLKIVVDGYPEGEPVRLRQVRVLAEPPNESQSLMLEPAYSSSPEFLAADDPANPLMVFHIPIRQNMVALANLILGGEDLTDHEKVLSFIEYIETMEVGSNDQTPQTVITHNMGACGGYTNVLLALAATQGILGRIIGLYNFPPDDGHVVAELYIDGDWRMYDPTYGVYYTDTPGEKRHPNVLSFEELRAGMGSLPGVVRLVSSARAAEQGEFAEPFMGPEIYIRAEPAGVVEPESRMIYPLQIDLETESRIGSSDFGPRNQGAWIIGVAAQNVSQLFSLEGLEVGKRYMLRVTYSAMGVNSRDLPTFEAVAEVQAGGELLAGGVYRYARDGENIPWEVEFVAQGREVKVLLTHAYDFPFYLWAESYELLPAAGD